MNTQWIGAHPNNFGVGRSGKVVNKVILHWIVGKLSAADATFQGPTRIASAHYGIGGSVIHQYVKEDDTAYHSGNLTVNRESVGIEHEGGPDLPISETTIQTSIKLVADICKRYGIVPSGDTIKRHSDFKSTACPGSLPVERIIQEVQVLLAPKNEPSDDEKRALAVLSKFKDANEELKAGNLEGAISAAVGAYKDLSKVQAENKIITELVTGLNRDLSGAKEGIKIYKDQQSKLAEKLNCKDDYPTISQEITKLLDVEDVAESEQAPKIVAELVKAIKNLFNPRAR